MSLVRLLLEGPKKKQKRWEKTHDKLLAVSQSGEREYRKKLNAWEKRRSGESRTEHAQRLATSSDVDQKFYDSALAKRKDELERLKEREAKHCESYDAAQRKRETEKRRKQMLKAPIPSLEPAKPKTPIRPKITVPRMPAPPSMPRTPVPSKLVRPRGRAKV